MKGISESNAWRFNSIGVAFATLAVLIVAQIIRIQIGPEADVFRKRGTLFYGETVTITPARGIIYDRWGNVLAGNKTVYQVGAQLNAVRSPETIALTLSNMLHVNYNDVFAAASIPPSDKAVYAVLADYLTQEQKDQLVALQEQLAAQKPEKNKKQASLNGLVFVPHLARTYPEKEVGSNIVGFVDNSGNGYGVEAKYNDLLMGTPQTVYISNDPNQASVLPLEPNGASLILTIDREMQSEVEKILDQAIQTTGSTGGTILVSDPKTGEILAMATTPRLDLNKLEDFTSVFPPGTPFNKAVSETYEPGSVFKVLTMAAAFDSGKFNPDTPFLDTGTFQIGGVSIHNWDGGAWGQQTMLGCMQHSLNVCLASVASELGPATFYKYMTAFGIGHITGIDLAGEAPGRLKTPGDGDWYDADLGTNSFGQGVSVTPVQMIMAISTVANHGKMVEPHLLRSMVDHGRQYDTPVQPVSTPITAEAADTLSNMLATSLEVEGSDALVDGYRVAGKTGTAEIPTPTGYTSSETNASFVGWGPVDDPKFIVYIWLEKPTTSPWGSVVAAPVFKQVVERIVVLMNLPPDNVRQELKLGQGH